MLSIYYSSAGALQIINSMESDQGKYECIAENSVGSEYSEPVTLYVKGRSTIGLTLTYTVSFSIKKLSTR